MVDEMTAPDGAVIFVQGIMVRIDKIKIKFETL